MTIKSFLGRLEGATRGHGLGLHRGYSIIRDLLVVIHLELLFLFRSSEGFFCHYKVSSAQGPKPPQQGKGPSFPAGLEPSW